MFDELGIRRCRSALGKYYDVDDLILDELLPVLNAVFLLAASMMRAHALGRST